MSARVELVAEVIEAMFRESRTVQDVAAAAAAAPKVSLWSELTLRRAMWSLDNIKARRESGGMP
jgi:hypothetical protein